MTEPVVLVERPADGVDLIRINRPGARNALTMEVRKAPAKNLTGMGEDPAIQMLFAPQAQKEGTAFIEKRKPKFTGR